MRDTVFCLVGDADPETHDRIRTSVEEMVAEAKSRGADAVIGVDLDYEVIGKEGSMLMVSASGTAVKLG